MIKRKPISKKIQERLEYEAWQAQHARAYDISMKKLAPVLEKIKPTPAIFKPSIKPIVLPKPEPIQRTQKTIDFSDMTLEELDAWNKREIIAAEEIRAKKARTGPVYNKGNSVYLSDDLLKDVKAGNTRRRN